MCVAAPYAAQNKELAYAGICDPFAGGNRRRELAKTLPAGALIAFTGGLGAGKTAFCQGLAEGLGCTDPVSSPTFAIVNYYRGPRPFAHFDLYRIHTEGDLAAAGFYDYLDMGAVVACEWSENCAELLDLENPLRIHIERVDETTRKITIG
jgi:tRNA threonylcarbamoyladenosine biosynthesis protein TsaE